MAFLMKSGEIEYLMKTTENEDSTFWKVQSESQIGKVTFPQLRDNHASL